MTRLGWRRRRSQRLGTGRRSAAELTQLGTNAQGVRMTAPHAAVSLIVALDAALGLLLDGGLDDVSSVTSASAAPVAPGSRRWGSVLSPDETARGRHRRAIFDGMDSADLARALRTATGSRGRRPGRAEGDLPIGHIAGRRVRHRDGAPPRSCSAVGAPIERGQASVSQRTGCLRKGRRSGEVRQARQIAGAGGADPAQRALLAR